MDSTKLTLRFLLVALLATLFCSCSGTSTEQGSLGKLLNPNEVSEETRQRLTKAREDLFSKLSQRLMKAIQEDGPVAAIRVCSQEAPEIAKSVSEEHGLKIGRTSLKLRNPNNQPPAWAKARIEKKPAEPLYIDLNEDRIGALLPIKLQTTCLLCHGPNENILPEIKTEIAKYYPKDTATGYQEGDLRGWFWIEATIN